MPVSTVYACVKIISEDVAKLRPSPDRKGKAGRRVAVTDHPVAALLRRPNGQQSWFDFCQQMCRRKGRKARERQRKPRLRWRSTAQGRIPPRRQGAPSALA